MIRSLLVKVGESLKRKETIEEDGSSTCALRNCLIVVTSVMHAPQVVVVIVIPVILVRKLNLKDARRGTRQIDLSHLFIGFVI